jgi:hypothetical protein
MIKNIIKLIILISISIKLVSCENKHKDWNRKIDSVEDMFNIFSKELKLSSEIYINDSIHLLNPFTIKIIDDQILIQDFGNKGGILSIYNMTNRKFAGMMLNQGKGPNEFLGLRMNSYGKDTLLALDPLKNSAQLFSINNIKTCKSTPNRIINFQTSNKGEQIDQCFFFENKLICSGQFQKGRFHVFNRNGNFLYEFDEYPKVNFGKTQIDNIQLGFVFGSNVYFYNNSKMSKIACLGSSTLSIYDYGKNSDELVKSFFAQWFSPAILSATYKNGKPYVIRSAKDCMLGAGSIVANDRYLFFPFSSYSINEIIKKGEEDNFKYIFVTNWDGMPVAKLILDKAIRFPLEIDKDGKFLYSIHTDLKTGFAQIVRFDISFLK